jgi:5-methylcytosine-specific restriction endonuclease McrA
MKMSTRYKVFYRLNIRKIFKRYGGICACCLCESNLTVDHIIPLSLGGHPYRVTNLQLLCESCNNRKGNRVIEYPRLTWRDFSRIL